MAEATPSSPSYESVYGYKKTPSGGEQKTLPVVKPEPTQPRSSPSYQSQRPPKKFVEKPRLLEDKPPSSIDKIKARLSSAYTSIKQSRPAQFISQKAAPIYSKLRQSRPAQFVGQKATKVVSAYQPAKRQLTSTYSSLRARTISAYQTAPQKVRSAYSGAKGFVKSVSTEDKRGIGERVSAARKYVWGSRPVKYITGSRPVKYVGRIGKEAITEAKAGYEEGKQESKTAILGAIRKGAGDIGRAPITIGRSIKERAELARERMREGKGIQWGGGLIQREERGLRTGQPRSLFGTTLGYEPSGRGTGRFRAGGAPRIQLSYGGGMHPSSGGGRMPRTSIPRGLIKTYWSKKLKKLARTNIRRFGVEDGLARTKQIAELAGWKMQ